MPDLDDLDNEVWNFLSWWQLGEILELMLEWGKTIGDGGLGGIHFAFWDEFELWRETEGALQWVE